MALGFFDPLSPICWCNGYGPNCNDSYQKNR